MMATFTLLKASLLLSSEGPASDQAGPANLVASSQ
jgi:hypothetical protein